MERLSYFLKLLLSLSMATAPMAAYSSSASSNPGTNSQYPQPIRGQGNPSTCSEASGMREKIVRRYRELLESLRHRFKMEDPGTELTDPGQRHQQIRQALHDLEKSSPGSFSLYRHKKTGQWVIQIHEEALRNGGQEFELAQLLALMGSFDFVFSSFVENSDPSLSPVSHLVNWVEKYAKFYRANQSNLEEAMASSEFETLRQTLYTILRSIIDPENSKASFAQLASKQDKATTFDPPSDNCEICSMDQLIEQKARFLLGALNQLFNSSNTIFETTPKSTFQIWDRWDRLLHHNHLSYAAVTMVGLILLARGTEFFDDLGRILYPLILAVVFTVAIAAAITSYRVRNPEAESADLMALKQILKKKYPYSVIVFSHIWSLVTESPLETSKSDNLVQTRLQKLGFEEKSLDEF